MNYPSVYFVDSLNLFSAPGSFPLLSFCAYKLKALSNDCKRALHFAPSLDFNLLSIASCCMAFISLCAHKLIINIHVERIHRWKFKILSSPPINEQKYWMMSSPRPWNWVYLSGPAHRFSAMVSFIHCIHYTQKYGIHHARHTPKNRFFYYYFSATFFTFCRGGNKRYCSLFSLHCMSNSFAYRILQQATTR